MGDRILSTSFSNHTARLEQTLITLQEQVAGLETVLAELHQSTAPIEIQPSSDLKVNLEQLLLLTAAYKSVNSSGPYLPTHDSLLPPLLAVSVISKTIQETQTAITETEASFDEVQRRVEKENSNLQEAKLIQSMLLTRIISLENDLNNKAQKSSTEINRNRVERLAVKKIYYDNETQDLLSAFNLFVDARLASMLAIEDLGGPIVGQQMDINDEMLESQFSYRGKTKKVKLRGDPRQKRIEQIWGTTLMNDNNDNEKHAAGTEIKQLVEELITNVTSQEDHGPGTYIKIQRESAAVRFLVRSNIAQLHPKDAKKLRLVDFGSEINN